jgi:uncharacterized protein YndB with AHSA1/START domain
MATSPKPGSSMGAAFRSHRVLPYPPRSVFEAFARPELLAYWWGPKEFTNSRRPLEVCDAWA